MAGQQWTEGKNGYFYQTKLILRIEGINLEG